MPAPSANRRDALTRAAFAALDARLDPASRRPLAVALSGGGDSIALLALATQWAEAHGRRVVALTVDHGLSPDSAAWSAFAGEAARAHGADWGGLTWTGDKPAAGLPAAARAARHALLADAARAAGVRVILTGHTADDVAEGDWMRAHGSMLGSLRDWSPSPTWPEGRGLMLLRPLLGIGRADLRRWLEGHGLAWIDDPANADLRFLRSRARAALLPLPMGEGLRLAERSDAQSRKGEGRSVAQWPLSDPHPFAQGRSPPALGRSSPLPSGEGVLETDRDLDPRTLAAALVCVGGGAVPPRGERLARLARRLLTGEDFDAVLVGARVVARGSDVALMREAGERRRGGLAPVRLSPDRAVVWDGRFEIGPTPVDGTIHPAAGRLSQLPERERAALARLPPPARAALPVLIRDDDPRPVLASEALRVRCLVAARWAAAVGAVSQEHDLDDASVGEIAPNILFQQATADEPPRPCT